MQISDFISRHAWEIVFSFPLFCNRNLSLLLLILASLTPTFYNLIPIFSSHCMYMFMQWLRIFMRPCNIIFRDEEKKKMYSFACCMLFYCWNSSIVFHRNLHMQRCYQNIYSLILPECFSSAQHMWWTLRVRACVQVHSWSLSVYGVSRRIDTSRKGMTGGDVWQLCSSGSKVMSSPARAQGKNASRGPYRSMGIVCLSGKQGWW